MDRIQLCEQKFKELFHAEPVKHEGTDPEFMRMLQRFILGEVCYTGEMDNQMRELITVVVLAVNQTLPQLKAHTQAALGGADLQVKSHAIGALKTGNSKETIVCALVHAMPYMGFPRLLNALNAMKEVLI